MGDGSLDMAKSFLDPLYMCCRVLGVRGEQIASSPVSRKGDGRGRGQLFIAELLKELERFLARSSQVCENRLHAVVVASIDVALIALVSPCHSFLSAHRAQVAGQARLASEREAQQDLNIALIFCHMSQVIFRSPRCFARNSTRRTWSLKFFGA